MEQTQPQQQPLAPPQLAATDSVNSSPRSHTTDSYGNDSFQLTSKLRLMCSFGGHIVPRPHDKSLCYIGGDTRIVVVDRQSSLSDLIHRLSKTLLNNTSNFTLKYQIPNEDLDSLISVTTDEDLENMIDEYDRLSRNSGAGKSGRLRLFLFPAKPESVTSIGSLLDNSAKSEDWFMNALNGTSTGQMSDSNSVNCLLGLDEAVEANNNNNGNNNENLIKLTGNVVSKSHQDVHSVPDSPMLDTTSSFGSASSTPSLANLPPIRVHVVEDHRKVAGIEEQFVQPVVAVVPPVVVGDYSNRIVSDDERSERSERSDQGGVSMAYRKQLLQQQAQSVISSKQAVAAAAASGGCFDLASPDSVSRLDIDDRLSVAAVLNIKCPKRMWLFSDITTGESTACNWIVLGGGFSCIFVGAVNCRCILPLRLSEPLPPVPFSFYPKIAVNLLSPYFTQSHHPAMDHQYPVYYVPAGQPQAYNMPIQQQGFSEASITTQSSGPQTPPATAAYNATRNAPVPKTEVAAGVYRTETTSTPFVQVPASQHQQQYAGFPQLNHPSQSNAPALATPANYAYQFADPAQAHMYYTQAMAPKLAAQYQNATSNAPESAASLPSDSNKQQARTS
uniref:PB1 domain-containing protein n=1 Tax=Daucus carota subsp. sativus TaxID=79200 RepID=A0A166EDR8_DAUCS